MAGPMVLLVLFLVVLLRTAWVSDDAFITLRTVDNFVEGHGLRWNTGERVQSYTHPLWMFLLSMVYGVLRHPLTATLLLSITTSMVAVWWLARRVALTPGHAMLGLTALLVSRAFVDYSTSGLENPLTHLLLGVGIWYALAHAPGPRKHLFWLTFIAGLSIFNRLDTGAFFAPAVIWYWWRTPGRLKSIGVMLLAMTPMICWEIFSLIYYGFLFPNTAYAKLSTGIPLGARLQQGFFYYANLLDTDPVTFVVIAGSLALTFMQRMWSMLPWAIGCVLYLLYIVYIGGDFMSGRFFAGPLLVSVALLMRQPVLNPPRFLLAAGAAVLALGFVVPGPTLTSDGTYGEDARKVDHRGVADERAVYFKYASLMAMGRGRQLPSNKYAKEGRKLAKRKTKVHYAGTIGYMGFLAGPDVHIVDVYALGDPLLARMPPRDEKKWRIGHVIRLTPKGYKKTLSTGKPHFVDKGVAEYNEALSLITRGPIWSSERFAAIWKMNTGHYDDLLDVDRIRAAGDDRAKGKKSSKSPKTSDKKRTSKTPGDAGNKNDPSALEASEAKDETGSKKPSTPSKVLGPTRAAARKSDRE